VIRSIGENMALNNGAYAMSGESIKNSGVWDKLRMIHQIIKAFDRACLPMTGSWAVYIANCCDYHNF
jgi:hypothetical protein